MAARQPLELIILVRIQAPQPEFPARKRGLSRTYQRGLSRAYQKGLSRAYQLGFFPGMGLAPLYWQRRLILFYSHPKPV